MSWVVWGIACSLNCQRPRRRWTQWGMTCSTGKMKLWLFWRIIWSSRKVSGETIKHYNAILFHYAQIQANQVVILPLSKKSWLACSYNLMSAILLKVYSCTVYSHACMNANAGWMGIITILQAFLRNHWPSESSYGKLQKSPVPRAAWDHLRDEQWSSAPRYLPQPSPVL